MAHLTNTPASEEISMASSSASNGSKNNNYVYDVFINHRGPEVKKTLAADLYHRLCNQDLRVFLDRPELQVGENITPQIESAIGTASVHIVIFSPQYADSSWCLNELLLMLNSGKTIIPVFYGVKPSELRWTQNQQGLFARALSILRCILLCRRSENGVYVQALRKLEKKKTNSQLQERYSSNTIEKWRNALFDVAEITGFES